MKWNIALCNYVKLTFLAHNEFPEILEAINDGYISCLFNELSKLPINYFVTQFWASLTKEKIPAQDQHMIYDLFFGSITFQVPCFCYKKKI